MAAPKTPTQKNTPLDAEAVIAMATLRETTVPLCLAGHLQGQYEALERQLTEAAATVGQSLVGTDRAGIARRMEDLRERMAEHLVEFRLRALSPRAWSDLVAEHPARIPNEGLNLATFGPAATAACLVEPAMTIEQFERLSEALTFAQQDTLMAAVWDLNTTAAQRVPFSLLASATAAGRTGES